jgi:pyruvate/oxaloacetate carboxyltransferase
MEGMDEIEEKPIKITDTTFRDGHPSTLAARTRTEEMVPIIQEIKNLVLKRYKMCNKLTNV